MSGGNRIKAVAQFLLMNGSESPVASGPWWPLFLKKGISNNASALTISISSFNI